MCTNFLWRTSARMRHRNVHQLSVAHPAHGAPQKFFLTLTRGPPPSHPLHTAKFSLSPTFPRSNRRPPPRSPRVFAAGRRHVPLPTFAALLLLIRRRSPACSSPLCYLLAVNGFRFLLDCGWTDHCDPALLQPLARYTPTPSSLLHSAAFTYASVRGCGGHRAGRTPPARRIVPAS